MQLKDADWYAVLDERCLSTAHLLCRRTPSPLARGEIAVRCRQGIKGSCAAQGGQCDRFPGQGPDKIVHSYMMSQAGHAASPVCSMTVHRDLASSEWGPALLQAVYVPSPARSLTVPNPVPPGAQQFEIKDAGAHPRVHQIAQLCTSIFEVPLVVAAVASGPTNYIFVQQVSNG